MPGKETWIIQFEDQDMPNEIFVGEGAEEAAKKRFDALSDNWTVTLLRSVPYPEEVEMKPECDKRGKII